MSSERKPHELDFGMALRVGSQHVRLAEVVEIFQSALVDVALAGTVRDNVAREVFEQVWAQAYQAGRDVAALEYRKSLRDEFAIGAMSLSAERLFMVARQYGPHAIKHHQFMAEYAWGVADAMLAVREQGGAS